MNNMKEELKLDSEYINVKVSGLDGMDVQFKIKKDRPMQKFMRAYLDHKGLAEDAIRFLSKGERVLCPVPHRNPSAFVKATKYTFVKRYTGVFP